MPGKPVNRLAIKTALFARLQGATFSPTVNGQTTWQESGRRLKIIPNLDSGRQPSLFLVQHRETYEHKGVGLVRRYLDMGAWCYASTADESVVGDDLLDAMESGIEAALTPDDPTRGELTLGGLVSWCRITRDSGQFIRDPGDLDGWALLVLPIRILIP